MTSDGERVVVRNQHPLLPAADVQQKTVGACDSDALYVRQWGTSGQGKGVAIHSDNTATPALFLRASGPAIQVYNSSGTLLFEVGSTGNLTVAGTLDITGGTTLTGNTTVTGTLGVTGATTLTTVGTSGAATLNSAAVTNNATVGGTLAVTGASTLTGAVGLGNAATVTRSADSSAAFGALVTGDTFDRFRVLADGDMEWGSGSGARDTNLYRTAANALATDDSLAVAGNAIGQFTPPSHGMLAWAYDPAIIVSGSTLTGGTVYLTKIVMSQSANITKLYWQVSGAGATPTADQNEVGIYNSAGTKLASTNVDSVISTTGLKTTTIASTAVTAGSFYWVAMVFNASTIPGVSRSAAVGGAGSLINAGLAASAYRFAINGTSQTALPASITPASNTQTSFAGPWVAVGV